VKGTDICDGFGNSWSRCKLGAECGLHVVRPGKAQCWCQDQDESRAQVQSAREEIAKLEADNERLREEVKTAKVDRDLAGWDDYAVIAKLKSDNDRLRVALEDIMTESDEQHIWRMARAALEKELKP